MNKPKLTGYTFGLYYKPIIIVNDDSSIINKLETSLIDDARLESSFTIVTCF
jgi:hypothetical protein